MATRVTFPTPLNMPAKTFTLYTRMLNNVIYVKQVSTIFTTRL